jgi:ABC-type nitrate/sulfonate/bicarbonate transport system substrate-binding protein
MKTKTIAPLFLTLAFIVACASAPAATNTAVPEAAEPVRPEKLYLESPDDSDISDLPRILAFEALQAQGYVIEPVSLAETTLVTVAMAQGDLDLAVVSNVDAWLSIQQGSEIVTLMDETANTKYLIVKDTIKQCADLNGQSLGVANLNGTATTYLYEYINRNCPGIEPNYLVVSGSGNRLVSLLAGELDAAMLDLGDYIELKNENQSTAYPLIIFAKEYPGLTTTSVYARREFAEQYPETVKDMLRNLLTARRQLQDPEFLANEIAQRFEMDAETARAVAQIYIDDKVWDVNGGYTLEKIQENIDFLRDPGGVELTLDAAAVSDLSYLNAVLDEIGHK